MNKSVNPLLAFVVLAIFGGLLALKFHFYGKALAVPTANTLKISPDGMLHIKLGTDLFKYSAEGVFKEKIKLKQFGVTENIGDFDFFSNGDLLINRDEYLPSELDKLKSYARMKNTDQSVSELGGLLRCNLTTLACFPFSQKLPALQGAHNLFIDRSNDDVYLADTTRHAVRKLDKSGELLAEIKTGLKFPNQVFLEGNKLWIVDTNHHVMKAVDASNDNFGDVIELHETVFEGSWIWPSAFSQVSEGWWVNVSGHAMENAKVVMFDNNWGKIDVLNLPENADPISSVKFNDSVIIADNNQYALYRFDLAGIRGPDFAYDEKGEGINAVLQQNKAENQKHMLWSDISLWVGIGLFTLLFAYALLQASKDQKEETERNEKNKDEITKQHILDLAKLPMDGEWVEAKPMMKYLKWVLVVLGVLLVISYLSIFSLLKDKLSLEMVAIFITIPVAFVLGMIPAEKLSRYRVGFFKNKVMIETHNGKFISAPYDEVKWTDRMFMINEWMVPIGNPSQSIFPYEKLVKKLMPYVKPDNKLKAMDAFKLQWKSPEGTLKYGIAMMVIMTILVLFLEKHKILSFFSSFI